MRALILGGAGFIGSHLAARLRADGHVVDVIDDGSRGQVSASMRVRDLADPFSWPPRATATPDHVYMLAAVVGVANVARDPARALDVNIRTVQNMLAWLPKDARLFFASTSEVYAGSVMAGVAPVPTPEDVPLLTVPDLANPRWSYALSKTFGEAAILYAGANAVIGRFHNVYGPRMGQDHAIPAIGMRMMRGDRPCALYGADQRRAFCYIDDAVDAMVRLMATDYRGVVNIGNDQEEVTVEEAAGEIAAALDLDEVVITREPAPAGSVDRRCPDLTRLRSLTGYEPRVPLADGVQRTMDWYAAMEMA